MTFDARKIEAETADEYQPFEFTGLDGETYHLPHPMELTTGQAEQANIAMRQGDDSMLLAIFETFEPAAADAVRAMHIRVTTRLFQAWRDSVSEEGKGRSESSSPNRTARRSKRTSRSEASGSTS
jgi:hypothetical protein